jgi:hypothetical protein
MSRTFAARVSKKPLDTVSSGQLSSCKQKPMSQHYSGGDTSGDTCELSTTSELPIQNSEPQEADSYHIGIIHALWQEQHPPTHRLQHSTRTPSLP